MKHTRIFVLLFALLMVLSTGLESVLAETIYENPILFRGIEWGTTYNEVVGEFGYKSKDERKWDPVGLDATFFDGEEIVYKDLGFRMESTLPKGETVAGYEVDSVYFYFVYTPDKTGQLSKKKEQAALCFAEYTLYFGYEEEYFEESLEDLTNKLTLLYGDVDCRPASKYKGTNAVWKGAEDTLVSLFCEGEMNLLTWEYWHRIRVRYSSGLMDTLLQDAKDAKSKITGGL